MNIIIGSANPHKTCEILDILKPLLSQRVQVRASKSSELIEVEETGETLEENAKLKALTLARHCNRWVLSDDSGIEVDALSGAPGVFSARYAGEPCDDKANNRKLLQALEGIPAEKRTASFRCVIALASSHEVVLTAEGKVEGRIDFQEKGSAGFGYDPLFYFPELHRTFGEITADVKQRYSHRARALQLFRYKLQNYLHQNTGICTVGDQKWLKRNM